MARIRESKVDYWLTDDGLMLIEAWKRDGNTMQDISDKIGIDRCTLQQWRNNYEEIDRALRTSQEIIDYKVENALLKRALGFTTKEVKVTLGKTIKGGKVYQVLKETTTKEFAPDTQAIIFWLNNRKYDQWKRNKDKVLELNEDDKNVSITITRGPSSDLGDNVNKEVTVRPKGPTVLQDDETGEEAKYNTVEEDLDDWSDWDGEDE